MILDLFDSCPVSSVSLKELFQLGLQLGVLVDATWKGFEELQGGLDLGRQQESASK